MCMCKTEKMMSVKPEPGWQLSDFFYTNKSTSGPEDYIPSKNVGFTVNPAVTGKDQRQIDHIFKQIAWLSRSAVRSLRRPLTRARCHAEVCCEERGNQWP